VRRDPKGPLVVLPDSIQDESAAKSMHAGLYAAIWYLGTQAEKVRRVLGKPLPLRKLLRHAAFEFDTSPKGVIVQGGSASLAATLSVISMMCNRAFRRRVATTGAVGLTSVICTYMDSMRASSSCITTEHRDLVIDHVMRLVERLMDR
jgi:hypothetical protein